MNKFSCIAIFTLALAPTFALGKISPIIQEQLKSETNINIFIRLKKSVLPLLKAAKLDLHVDYQSKNSNIISQLKKFTNTSQASVLQFLKSELPNAQLEQFWITNRIFVKNVPKRVVYKLAERQDVDEIHENAKYSIDNLTGTKHAVKNEDLTYGLKLIGVEKAWNQGYDGSGVKIGLIDSGVKHTHQALKTGYAAKYGWFDVFNQVETPYDNTGHGSHVAGTAAGTHNIGVAKGATHMHCAAFDRNGVGSTQAILSCGQFMACPTLSDGSEPDCTQAPQVIVNSWGRPVFTEDFQDMVETWNVVGIIGVFAGGNSGYKGCNTISYPGGYNMDVISVGNTNETDYLYRESSRGPSVYKKIKPDICAPGTNVISVDSVSDTGYKSGTGTSMATPHVAGAIAILLQVNPSLTFNQITQALYVSANTNISAPSENCGGISESTIPNNSFGHGRLSVSDALNYVQKYTM